MSGSRLNRILTPTYRVLQVIVEQSDSTSRLPVMSKLILEFTLMHNPSLCGTLAIIFIFPRGILQTDVPDKEPNILRVLLEPHNVGTLLTLIQRSPRAVSGTE